jgi:hypothetical protein
VGKGETILPQQSSRAYLQESSFDFDPMITGYSSLTPQEVRREIKAIREETKRLTSSPKRALSFLIKAGFLTKDGKRLAPQYR